MKKLIIILMLLFCFPANAYAESFTATWDTGTNSIRLTWDKLPDSDAEYYLYHNYGDGWVKDSSGKIGNNTTARTITNFHQNSECQYQIRSVEGGKSITHATSNKVNTKTNKFTATVKWTGNDIEISWRQPYYSQLTIWTDEGIGGGRYIIRDSKEATSPIRVSEHGFSPSEGQVWKFVILDSKERLERTISCGSSGSIPTEDDGSNSSGGTIKESIPIFQANSWSVVMFWYLVLASLSGVFIFFTFIRCGYQYMNTNNAGVKASVINTLQKCVLAMVFIMMAPTIIDILIQINDAIVELCLKTLNQLAGSVELIGSKKGAVNLDAGYDGSADWLSSLFAFPFKAILGLVEKLFGLHDLGTVIFNTAPDVTILSDKIIFGGGANVNPLGEVLLGIAFLGFAIYYNAVYYLRRWVIVAVTAVTPLIVWVWAISENKQIIQIWLAEIIQTIFMQTFHALTFGIFFSILCFGGTIPSLISTESTAALLISVGKLVAWFAGLACVGAIMFCSFQIITSTSDKTLEEAKSNLARSIMGLVIIGLSLSIAGVLTSNALYIPIPDESSGVSQITVFQLFMVLVAIIPISKMMSTIFMNLISRIGTVDEDRWAAKSLGMIGGAVALGSAVKNGIKSPKPDTSNDLALKPPESVPAKDNLNYNSDPYGIRSTLNNSPGTVSSTGQQGSFLRPQDVGQKSGNWVYNHDTGKVQEYNDFVSGSRDYLEPPAKTLPEGIPVPSSVDPKWEGTLYNPKEDKFYDPNTGEEVGGIPSPELTDWMKNGCVDPNERRKFEKSNQEKSFKETLTNASEGGVVSGASRAGERVGTVGDTIAPGTKGFFKGMSTSVGAVAASMSAMNAGAKIITKEGFGKGNIKEFTGRDSTLGGVAQMGTAVVLSPFGANVSGGVSTKIGGGIDVIAPPIGNVAKTASRKIQDGADWIYPGWTN